MVHRMLVWVTPWILVAGCAAPVEGPEEEEPAAESASAMSAAPTPTPTPTPTPDATMPSCTTNANTCLAECGTTRLCEIECSVLFAQCKNACTTKRTACYAHCVPGQGITCSLACTLSYDFCVGR